MSWTERARDAAMPANLRGWGGVIGGYLHTGDPFHPWSEADWRQFAGLRKLPIVAKSNPGTVAQAENDAFSVLQELWNLRVPKGVYTVLDLETAVNPDYVTRYGDVIWWGGYKVFPYGSTSSLFRNPPLNGYWVAAPSMDGKPYMYSRARTLIRMTQYAENVKPGYDSSTVKWWTYFRGAWWR